MYRSYAYLLGDSLPSALRDMVGEALLQPTVTLERPKNCRSDFETGSR